MSTFNNMWDVFSVIVKISHWHHAHRLSTLRAELMMGYSIFTFSFFSLMSLLVQILPHLSLSLFHPNCVSGKRKERASGALTGSRGHETRRSALTDVCSERGNTIRVLRAVSHRWLGHCGSLSTFRLGGQSKPSHLLLGIFSLPLALTSLKASVWVKLIVWLPTTNTTEPPDMTQGDLGVTVWR